MTFFRAVRKAAQSLAESLASDNGEAREIDHLTKRIDDQAARIVKQEEQLQKITKAFKFLNDRLEKVALAAYILAADVEGIKGRNTARASDPFDPFDTEDMQ